MVKLDDTKDLAALIAQARTKYEEYDGKSQEERLATGEDYWNKNDEIAAAFESLEIALDELKSILDKEGLLTNNGA